MRPGQAAPVFRCMEVAAAAIWRASMRPGQAAPVFADFPAPIRPRRRASMRPGQAAPVFQLPLVNVVGEINGFNEAGAGCPGIPYTLCAWMKGHL